jgi:hypothetical protein
MKESFGEGEAGTHLEDACWLKTCWFWASLEVVTTKGNTENDIMKERVP